MTASPKPDRSETIVLGIRWDVSNERIKRVPGWKPRSVEEIVVAMGESMIHKGLV